MKKIDPRLLLAVGAAGLAMAAWLLLMGAVVWSTLQPAERAAVGEVLAPRVALVALGWLAGVAVVGGALQGLYRRYVGAPARLLEETRVVLAATTPQQLKPRGTAEMQALATAVNELAAQRDGLRADMDAQVAQASHSVQQEKNRLAALMAELNQSVVVCNRDGRILLYNQRARQQFRALSQGADTAAGAELMGIGRSVYAVFDRQVLAHALERIHQAMARGAPQPLGPVCDHRARRATAARAGSARAHGGRHCARPGRPPRRCLAQRLCADAGKRDPKRAGRVRARPVAAWPD